MFRKAQGLPLQSPATKRDPSTTSASSSSLAASTSTTSLGAGPAAGGDHKEWTCDTCTLLNKADNHTSNAALYAPGKARIACGTLSVASRLWRLLRNTFSTDWSSGR